MARQLNLREALSPVTSWTPVTHRHLIMIFLSFPGVKEESDNPGGWAEAIVFDLDESQVHELSLKIECCAYIFL